MDERKKLFIRLFIDASVCLVFFALPFLESALWIRHFGAYFLVFDDQNAAPYYLWLMAFQAIATFVLKDFYKANRARRWLTAYLSACLTLIFIASIPYLFMALDYYVHS